eukprot:6464964-Amphidinium_carterae.1
MATTAPAPDCCGEGTGSWHTLANQRTLILLDEEAEVDISARLEKTCSSIIVKKAAVAQEKEETSPTAQVDYSLDGRVYIDFEADYTDYEEENIDMARDRRICLLSSRLEVHNARGSMENEIPEIGADVQEMTEIVLVNPRELAQLCRLHILDLHSKTPRAPYLRRDVTWDLPKAEMHEMDDSLDLLRFTLIAHWPKLLGWKRVCRSPLTADDLHPERAQCIIEGCQTLLAWDNPHRAQQIEWTY